MLVEDDQSRPEEASNAVTKLVTQDRVVAVIGEVASRRTLAAAPVAQRYKVPMITPASTNEKVTAVGDYIFRVCFIDPFQGEVLAKFAYNDLKARRAAILTDIQQDYSVGLTAAVTEHFKAPAGRCCAPVSYSSGDADFRAVLTQIRSQKPDAIFRDRLLPGGGHHRAPGARARHDDADSRRRRLGGRLAEERPRGAARTPTSRTTIRATIPTRWSRTS